MKKKGEEIPGRGQFSQCTTLAYKGVHHTPTTFMRYTQHIYENQENFNSADCLSQQPPRTSSRKRNRSTPSCRLPPLLFSHSFLYPHPTQGRGDQLAVSTTAEHQKQREEEEGEQGEAAAAAVAEAWTAASAAPWRPCTGFRGTPSVLPATRAPRPSSDF